LFDFHHPVRQNLPYPAVIRANTLHFMQLFTARPSAMISNREMQYRATPRKGKCFSGTNMPACAPSGLFSPAEVKQTGKSVFHQSPLSKTSSALK